MKNKINLILIGILLIILIPNVASLGISPGRTTLDYKPEMQKEIQLSILNKEYKTMKVSLTVEGELKDYITLSEESVEFSTLDYSKDISYRINLPDSIKDDPGLHTAEIVALETPGGAEGATHIGATVAVVSQLHIYVPCPGKCIDADLNVLDGGENGTATFIVAVINRGEQKIEKANAEIEIISGGEKVDTVETNALPIESGARTELINKWTASKQGEYIARVTVFYDGKSKTFEKPFTIGDQILSISRIWVSDFRLGGIAKFRILVENKWNQELKDVFANLIIYNRGYTMADIKSASEDIPMQSEKELVAYWDTAGVEEGMYDGKLMIKYGKKSTDRDLSLRLTEDSLEIIGYAAGVEAGKGVSLTTILIVLVVVLLIANISWFVFFRRFMKKRKKIRVSEGVIKA